MSLGLDPNTTKALVSQSLTEPKLKKDAVKLSDRLGSLFLLYVTSGANEICDEKKRKTIEPEDVLQALKDRGFEHYVGPLRAALESGLLLTHNRSLDNAMASEEDNESKRKPHDLPEEDSAAHKSKQKAEDTPEDEGPAAAPPSG